jgi:hypothetical protein
MFKQRRPRWRERSAKDEMRAKATFAKDANKLEFVKAFESRRLTITNKVRPRTRSYLRPVDAKAAQQRGAALTLKSSQCHL